MLLQPNDGRRYFLGAILDKTFKAIMVALLVAGVVNTAFGSDLFISAITVKVNGLC